MEGADESIELWRHPLICISFSTLHGSHRSHDFKKKRKNVKLLKTMFFKISKSLPRFILEAQNKRGNKEQCDQTLK